MTLEERIEAAAREWCWDGCQTCEDPSACRHHAPLHAGMRSYLAAAFPELFSSPPTHWIAPLPDIDADEEWEVVDGPAW